VGPGGSEVANAGGRGHTEASQVPLGSVASPGQILAEAETGGDGQYTEESQRKSEIRLSTRGSPGPR
jgi:hypothetical protein